MKEKGIWREVNCKLLKKKAYSSNLVTYCYCTIIEAFRLEKTFKIIESNRKPNTAKSTRSHGNRC